MVSDAIAGVVLAAGASTRFGSLKQNHRVDGQTMLERTVDLLAEAGCAPILVVTGAESDAIQTGWGCDDVRLVHNPDWSDGMGRSIAVGVNAARDSTDTVSAVLISVCDQPQLDAAVLRRLIDRFRAGPERVIGCEYGGCRGVPAIFGESWFDRLCRLKGGEGARRLLRDPGESGAIPWPAGAFDIDRPSDLARPT
jgi:molybdenum cofactor cytidylyltransferase